MMPRSPFGGACDLYGMSSKEVAFPLVHQESPEVINAWLSQVVKDLLLPYSGSGVYSDTCIFLVFMTNCVSEEQ